MAAFRHHEEDNDEYFQALSLSSIGTGLTADEYEMEKFVRADGGRENSDDEETPSERLLGLTEMFPPPVRKTGSNVFVYFTSLLKGLFRLTCNLSWFTFATSILLLAPLAFEYERRKECESPKKNGNKFAAHVQYPHRN